MNGSSYGKQNPNGVPEQRNATVEIGILTKGKPTLSVALVSLLLQEISDIRIHIVDTGDSPVIKRDDVVFVLRLAFDRGISCGYEHIKERHRAFSVGRLKLMEALRGPNICFMDDDVVMASTTLSQMLPVVEANPSYGYITPYCKNAGFSGGPLAGIPHFSPGGLFYQDDLVRRILLEYYATTVDVLDEKRVRDKVWEIAFLSEVFSLLGRRCIVQPDNIPYPLDYHEPISSWNWDESRLVAASVAKARELVKRLR